jgi:hypothetical protein
MTFDSRALYDPAADAAEINAKLKLKHAGHFTAR